MKNLSNYQFIKQLEALAFIDVIYLYGSRARGDAGERSDIDLAIECSSASDSDWLKVLDIIDKADTLLPIDCVRLDEMKDSRLLENIQREKKVLYVKE